MPRCRKRPLAALSIAAALLLPGRTLAGTTGNINGIVQTTGGAPVAGARIAAVSPSQSATVTSDQSGRFAFLSLVPDTYTITATKDGYETTSLAGISVFADQRQNVHVTMAKTLHTIARVTTRSTMDVVKPGTTSDVYSVNSTVTKAAAGIGGGGSLNSAYSAIATVPGLYVPPEQQGWNQVVYIRGGSYDQIGYEYDGVPVNRSFDNYPGGTAGTLGQQEVEVYTGGGTAGANATGLAGFINQVIKTGTYPGYGNVSIGVGTPIYYHNLNIEVGGASPDRLFSYYVGMGGYNQSYRYLNQFNGASLQNVWGYSIVTDNTSLLYYNYPGVYPTCTATTLNRYAYKNVPVYNPFNPSQVANPVPLPVNKENPNGLATDPGCYGTVSPAFASYSNIMDRENVVNLHFGIPHHRDAGRDDVQLLYNTTTMLSQFYSSANDIGAGIIPALNYLGYGYAAPEYWGDFVTWPSGTKFGQNAQGMKPVAYHEPSTPRGRCANVDPFGFFSKSALPANSCPQGTVSAIEPNNRDGFWNDATIVKLQYQHNMGSTAYVRVYGYTFYSDWLQNGPLSWGTPLYGFGVLSYDYELGAHTSGIAAEFADQFNSQNLLTLDLNYTTAQTFRYNNTNFNNYLNTSATNLVDKNGNCIAWQTGPLYSRPLPPGFPNPTYRAGQVAPCNNYRTNSLTSGTFENPTPAGAPSGASWQVTYTGNSGLLNTVVPKFATVGIQDKMQPTDKLDIDFGLRLARYQFDLANTSNDGQDFWYAAGQKEFCYNPVTFEPVEIPPQPASGQPAEPFIGFTCPIDRSSGSPVQTVHPDGKNGHELLSNAYSPTETDSALEPRFGMTYTLNSDTVLRFSAGRYVQEPQNYEVQYNAKDNNLAFNLFQAWWQYGFTTPRHDPQVQYSNNFDLSFERRFKGTDMSIKVTPYYRYATGQLYSVGLPYGISGSLNSGIESIQGLELQFTKGDFSKNGLAFILSYTYQNSSEKWANYPGTPLNPVDPYNVDIQSFNALTKAGGGAPCYLVDARSPAGYIPDPSCKGMFGRHAIANPYYAMHHQPLLDRNGWYPVGLDYPYLVPHTLTALVNYRHNKLAITPALTLNSGALYGNPADVAGIDPRTCTRNSRGFTRSPISTKNPLQADYTSCRFAATPGGTLYIPNPETGTFDTFGAFRQPSQLNLSLNMQYDLTSHIKANLLLTNLVNACFGGTKTPWSAAFPPNAFTCGYVQNYYYISNFYNGTSPHDKGANGVGLNPAFAHSYIPAWADTNAFTLPVPFNAYVQVNIAL